MRLFEGVRLAFGPTIDGGFYYDFALEHALTEDDFPVIEKEMERIIALNEPFERIEQPREQALQICHDLEQDFKVEHIEEGLAEHETLSFYRQGESERSACEHPRRFEVDQDNVFYSSTARRV